MPYFFNSGISFVALFCTFSNISISPFYTVPIQNYSSLDAILVLPYFYTIGRTVAVKIFKVIRYLYSTQQRITDAGV